VASRWPLGTRGVAQRQLAFVPRVGVDAPRNRASHERILERAIDDFFTEEAFLDIVQGTVDQDALEHQGVSEAETAAHSMRSPFGSARPETAVRIRDAKIAREMDATAALIVAGRMREARLTFGRLTHTIQDKYPHAHTAGADGKVPLPWNPADPKGVRAHILSDSSERMGTPNVNAAVAETLQAFEKLEAAVLAIPKKVTQSFKPDLTRYEAFLRFRGIHITGKATAEAYLKDDQERWQARAQAK
jgi:hypothetical protein